MAIPEKVSKMRREFVLIRIKQTNKNLEVLTIRFRMKKKFVRPFVCHLFWNVRVRKKFVFRV